mmetsp:Transcript_46633/g.107722  ORF Transcript_46633/g.107722 Transcript_46633/m.107722 type:complete len:241 (-) Transcript_46633:434-1156(-)
MLAGGSKLTTICTFLMSRPRWATSVATRTLALPCLNAHSAWSRSRWSMSPCRQTMGAPARASVECILEAARFVLVKMSAAPPVDWSNGKITSSKCLILSLSPRIFTMCCWMSALVVWASELPTWMCVGCCVKVSATCFTSRGQVAVKRAVCLSCGRYLASSLTCGSKPMSSMRSASSSTKYTQALILTELSLKKSFRRPGVATTHCGPFIRLRICGPRGAPPKTQAVLMHAGLPKRSLSS